MIQAPEGILEPALRLAVAALLAGLIGWEREGKGRDAGLRTNMLVALGSAAFMLLGMELLDAAPASADSTRVLAGIVGGVGFLGAGAIIQSQGQVRGLTTAAGIWTCAAIGAAAGAGLYTLAALTSAAGLVVLVALRPLKRQIKDKEDR